MFKSGRLFKSVDYKPFSRFKNKGGGDQQWDPAAALILSLPQNKRSQPGINGSPNREVGHMVVNFTKILGKIPHFITNLFILKKSYYTGL